MSNLRIQRTTYREIHWWGLQSTTDVAMNAFCLNYNLQILLLVQIQTTRMYHCVFSCLTVIVFLLGLQNCQKSGHVVVAGSTINRTRVITSVTLQRFIDNQQILVECHSSAVVNDLSLFIPNYTLNSWFWLNIAFKLDWVMWQSRLVVKSYFDSYTVDESCFVFDCLKW